MAVGEGLQREANKHRSTGSFLLTGTLWGKPFAAQEFPSHVELFRTLAPDVDHDEVRCWVLTKSKKGPYWLELVLDCSQVFETLMKCDNVVLNEGRVSIQFRRKPCNSPNEDSSASTTLASATTFFEANNKIDPFTRKEVNQLDCVLVLNFGEQGFIAVDKRQFEQFVIQAEKDGKSFDELSLRHVEFDDGTSHDLALDWSMWTEQILPVSKLLRASYFGVQISDKVRGNKLREIQQHDPQLWARITYWVADFGDMEALERLEMPFDESVPPYMSPFYFSKQEATKLGELVGPSSASLGDALRAKSSMATCAAHDLKPLLETAFQLKQGFHKAPGFCEKKQAWIKKRQQQLATKRVRPQTKKKVVAPIFGGFGIR